MNYFEDLGSALAYGAVGLALLVVGYLMVDLITPGHLGRAIVESRSMNAAVVAGGVLVSLGAIIVSAIVASQDDKLIEGLGQALGYGIAGIVLLAVSILVVDVLTPGRLGAVVHDEGLSPLAVMLAAFMIAAGAVLAGAIS